jgi:hypothetical protein
MKNAELLSVIPASEARRESFFRKDSGQAGMTFSSQGHLFNDEKRSD